MRKPILSTGLRWLWLAFLVLAIDLLSKYWVMDSFALYESMKLLPFFNFTYVHNTGAAFSVFEGQRWPLIAVAVLICSFLSFMLYRTAKESWMVNIAYCLIIGGAIGNLVDRLVHGYVIDFLHFYIKDWHYPVFNIADVAICIGAGLIVLDAIIAAKKGD